MSTLEPTEVPHDEKPLSISSLSDHLEDLRANDAMLKEQLLHIRQNIDFHTREMEKCVGIYTERALLIVKEEAEEIKLWEETERVVELKHKKLGKRLREIYASEKPKKRTAQKEEELAGGKK